MPQTARKGPHARIDRRNPEPAERRCLTSGLRSRPGENRNRARIVSLTITEGGYHFDDVTGEFNSSDPSVAADLRSGAIPRTVFGIVTEALARRRARGVPAFTILSCDNIQGNGHMSQRAFTAFARLRDPGQESAGLLGRGAVRPGDFVTGTRPLAQVAEPSSSSRREIT